jgi:hypothetical protein
VIGWELAASLWLVHQPAQIGPTPYCPPCGWRMPCPCWRFADDFLAEIMQHGIDERTRELPRVAPPLPRRKPGAHVPQEERYDDWFTRTN